MAQARLVVDKSHTEEDLTGTPGLYCEGDRVLFTLGVVEQGTSPEVFQIIDQIDGDYYSDWEIVATTGTECSTGVGPLMPGQGASFCARDVTANPGDPPIVFQYRVTLRGNPPTSRVCQQALALVGASSYASNRDCVDLACPLPKISLTKTYLGPAAPALGDLVGWRIEVENSGDVADSLVRLQDRPTPGQLSWFRFQTFSRPPDTPPPAAGQDLDVTWNQIAVGEKLSVELWGPFANCAPASSEVCNQASVTTAQYPNPRLSRPPGAPQEAPTCVAGPPGTPRLLVPIPKSVIDLDGAPTQTGHQVEYTVILQNDGWCDFAPGRFTDLLPAGVTLDRPSVTVTPAGAGVNNSTASQVIIDSLVVPGTRMVAGQVVVRFRAQVTAASGFVCNRGQADFGSGALDTADACLTVGSFAALTAAKTHDDPNRDGTLARGQQLQYRVGVQNDGNLAAADVNVHDVLPAGVLFVSLDADAGGTVISTGPTVEVDMIRVDPGGPSTAREVRFTVREDGSQPLGSSICNTATVKTGGVGQPITPPACVTLIQMPACAMRPAAIPALGAVKAAPGVRLSWAQEANSTRGYRVYAVGQARDIPTADRGTGLTPECQTTGVAALGCDDPDGLLTAGRLYYQVVGVCADDSEGAH